MVDKLDSVPQDAVSKHELKEDNVQFKETIKTVIDPSFGRKRWQVVTEAIAYDEAEGEVILRNLESRQEVNFEENIGKTMFITADAPKSQQGGFYCETCDCLMKDSSAYLDHINGKKHNKLKGMTMQVSKVDAARVQQRLDMLKRKKETKQTVNTFVDIEKKLQEEELKRKKEFEAKQKIKKKVKQQNEQIEEFLQNNSELQECGLPMSFGSTKK